MTNWFTAILSSIFVIYVFLLVRKNLIYLSYVLFWLALCITVLILGFFPNFNIYLAQRLGIHYYPILPIILAILVIFWKLLKQDIELSDKEKKIKRMIQEIAIIKHDFNEKEK